jgi:hypothetical protein
LRNSDDDDLPNESILVGAPKPEFTQNSELPENGIMVKATTLGKMDLYFKYHLPIKFNLVHGLFNENESILYF